jgi:hypothetical protein
MTSFHQHRSYMAAHSTADNPELALTEDTANTAEGREASRANTQPDDLNVQLALHHNTNSESCPGSILPTQIHSTADDYSEVQMLRRKIKYLKIAVIAVISGLLLLLIAAVIHGIVAGATDAGSSGHPGTLPFSQPTRQQSPNSVAPVAKASSTAHNSTAAAPMPAVYHYGAYVAPACRRGGCAQQLCLPASSGLFISTCVWSPEYSCYNFNFSRCEPQPASGQCSWTRSTDLTRCLSNMRKLS